MPFVQSNLLSIFIICGGNFFLKVGQEIVEVMFLHSKETLFIDKDANSFSVFLKIGITDGDLFFGGNGSVPVNISPSFVRISGSSSGFLLIAGMPNDNFRLNYEACFFVNSKILLKLLTV
jgi:hypothetical protein